MRVWTAGQFSETFGRSFDAARDAVTFMNSDGAASNAHVQGATFLNSEIYATLDRVVRAPMRIGYIVVLGG